MNLLNNNILIKPNVHHSLKAIILTWKRAKELPPAIVLILVEFVVLHLKLAGWSSGFARLDSVAGPPVVALFHAFGTVNIPNFGGKKYTESYAEQKLEILYKFYSLS